MTKSASFSALLAAPAVACCFFAVIIARQYEVCEYGGRLELPEISPARQTALIKMWPEHGAKLACRAYGGLLQLAPYEDLRRHHPHGCVWSFYVSLSCCGSY